MKLATLLLSALLVSTGFAEDKEPTSKLDIPYAEPGDPLQKLDIFAPSNAKNLPVIVWIHGGGWTVGDKKEIVEKPKALTQKGFVFVSINYRMLPAVTMGELIRDCAKATGWVGKHIAEYGGDPQRLFIAGHSAGAQLAAILCTDERYLKAEGVPFTSLKGCVPVDGDTYDIPIVIERATATRRAAGKPEPTFGHREKFGSKPELWADFSAVNHVEKGKNIPPFLLLHVNTDPSTTIQAHRLGIELTKAGIPAKVFGASDTNHNKLNDSLGLEGDPATKELYEFLDASLKR